MTSPTNSTSPSGPAPRPALTARAVPLPKKWLPRRQNTAPAPLARTDPYQAPYFFPTPLSPEAADYVRQVRISRGAAAGAGTQFEQRRCEGGSGHARMRSRDATVDEQLAVEARQKAAAAVERVEEVEMEKEKLEGLGKLKQLPKRRLSWQPAPVAEEPASAARPSGSDSAPSSPNSFLRKSRRSALSSTRILLR